MKLLTQQHLVQKEWVPHPVLVSHEELLGNAKQIIRLRDPLYTEVVTRLTAWEVLTIFNRINPVNADLIRRFRWDKENNNWAKVWRIAEASQAWPVIALTSLKAVSVLDMGNIFFEDIEEQDLDSSLASKWKNKVNSVSELLLWISERLYDGSISPQQIESDQRLFYRRIQIS